jgi:hypothetical protein
MMKRHLVPVVMLVLGVLAAGAASAQNPDFNNIGPVSTWAQTPDQRVDDKTFTYISNSANWSVFAVDDVTLRAIPTAGVASISVDGLENGIVDPLPYELSYKITIDASNLLYFLGARLDTTTLLPGVTVTKEIYNSALAFGSDTPFLTLTSVDGVPDPVGPYTPFGGPLLKEIWVKDSIFITSNIAGLTSFVDTFFQVAVPEIDPGSFGSALALLMGSLGLVERRMRKLSALSGLA